ncbi:hypothetical protein AN639_03715 [Candidatus Epulonipiscium fishelsonii]|uniref:Uncharacterized protein n=1 Tax=Candidatus Epulonipiscium fishelsonii TaxID=77094 RepID=A0ACC8X6B6_9FIRM|nr:hypothetical protein AN396_12810 [Epulopiscium sp. SCG-B11WGA-EpuloA1]ONI41469.1 hypothetical protein AN639_03715 [Epulopiscium sp. SCG-B05WGA-EpuloA1]
MEEGNSYLEVLCGVAIVMGIAIYLYSFLSNIININIKTEQAIDSTSLVEVIANNYVQIEPYLSGNIEELLEYLNIEKELDEYDFQLTIFELPNNLSLNQSVSYDNLRILYNIGNIEYFPINKIISSNQQTAQILSGSKIVVILNKHKKSRGEFNFAFTIF